MRSNFIILSALILFGMVLLSAQDPDFVYKAGEDIDVKLPCTFNGTYCSATAVCNLTMIYPDGDVLVNNVQMTNNIAYHNYTLFKQFTWTSGIYPYTQKCDDVGYSGIYTGYIQITPTGDKAMLGFYFLIIILSYGVMVFGVWKKDITLTILGTFALFFVGLFVMFYGIDVYKNKLTEAFSIITLAIAGYISVLMAHEYIVEADI